MGKCFGKCLSDNQENGREFSYLVEEGSSSKIIKRNFLARIFHKQNVNNKKKPVLNLVDGLLNPQVAHYSRLTESRLPSTGSCNSRDIQLQCLDARALLARTATSTPASSLDLEWEHETLPISMVHDPSGSSWTTFPEEFPQFESRTASPQPTAAASNSVSDWSRVSSVNSLEWDNVHNSIQASSPTSEIDTDTQFLLNEIERLTSKTLSETGKELYS